MGIEYDRVGLLVYGGVALICASLLGAAVMAGLTDLAAGAGICLGIVILVLYQELP